MPYGQDVENSSAANMRSSNNSLPERPAGESKSYISRFLPIFQLFGGGVYAPDPSTYDPIEIILNTEDEQERDELTVRWRDNKLSELNFVGIVVC